MQRNIINFKHFPFAYAEFKPGTLEYKFLKEAKEKNWEEYLLEAGINNASIDVNYDDREDMFTVESEFGVGKYEGTCIEESEESEDRELLLGLEEDDSEDIVDTANDTAYKTAFDDMSSIDDIDDIPEGNVNELDSTKPFHRVYIYLSNIYADSFDSELEMEEENKRLDSDQILYSGESHEEALDSFEFVTLNSEDDSEDSLIEEIIKEELEYDIDDPDYVTKETNHKGEKIEVKWEVYWDDGEFHDPGTVYSAEGIGTDGSSWEAWLFSFAGETEFTSTEEIISTIKETNRKNKTMDKRNLKEGDDDKRISSAFQTLALAKKSLEEANTQLVINLGYHFQKLYEMDLTELNNTIETARKQIEVLSKKIRTQLKR